MPASEGDDSIDDDTRSDDLAIAAAAAMNPRPESGFRRKSATQVSFAAEATENINAPLTSSEVSSSSSVPVDSYGIPISSSSIEFTTSSVSRARPRASVGRLQYQMAGRTGTDISESMGCIPEEDSRISAIRRNSPSPLSSVPFIMFRRSSPSIVATRPAGTTPTGAAVSGGTSSSTSPAVKLVKTLSQGFLALQSILPPSRQESGEPNSVTLETFAQDQDAALGAAFSGQANDWENMAAAAAVVTGGTAATDTRTHRRYSVGDSVLVVGRIATSGAAGPPSAMGSSGYGHRASYDQQLILNPVNKYGYPPGKGTMEEERRPPYVYVLATVKKVHFEEDARYYTVTRQDNQCDQRADTGE